MTKYCEKNDAKIVQSILEDHKLTKSKLALLLNTSYSHIVMILSGQRNLGKRTLATLMQKFPGYVDTSVVIPDEISAEEFKAIRLKLRMSQSDLARALQMSQAIIAKIELGDRKVSKATVRALKELASPNEGKPTFSILYAPDELLNNLYVNNNKTNIDRVVIDQKLLTSEVHCNCKVITLGDNSCYPMFDKGDKVIMDPTVNKLCHDKLQVIRVNDVTYIGRIIILPDKIKCVPINEKYDSFYINKDTSVIGNIIPRIRF